MKDMLYVESICGTCLVVRASSHVLRQLARSIRIDHARARLVNSVCRRETNE